MSNKNQGNSDYYYKVFSENTDNSYFGKYGTDVVLTVGSISLIILIYLFFEYRKKVSYFNHALDNSGNSVWAKEKCKPYILPISGMIKQEPGMNSYESTYHNFKKCSEDGYKSGAWKFFNPLYLISGSITTLFTAILSIISTVRQTVQTISHYIIDRFKSDKRKIDKIEQEITYTLSQHIYKRLNDSVRSFKDFFINVNSRNSKDNLPEKAMGLWEAAQTHIGRLLRKYHLKLFSSMVLDLKSQAYFQRMKSVIVAGLALATLGPAALVAAAVATGGYALLAGAVILAIFVSTIALMHSTYIQMRQKVINEKRCGFNV